MSRPKPQKKWQVVRTDKPPIRNGSVANLARVSPAGILWLVERGLDVRGYTNPGLSWAIWGMAGIWLWWSICKSGLISRVLPQYTKSKLVYWVGVALLGLSFGAKSWHSPWHKPVETAPTDMEVVKAVRDADQHQTEELSRLRTELSKKMDDYFGNQPPNEKEKWRQYLTRNYPLGWNLLAADGRTIYTPNGLSYQRDLVVVWGSERVSELTPDKVRVRLPDIAAKNVGVVFTGGMEWGVKRTAGSTMKSMFGRTLMVLEVLEDKGDFVVVALAFREATKSDQLPPLQGSERAPIKTKP